MAMKSSESPRDLERPAVARLATPAAIGALVVAAGAAYFLGYLTDQSVAAALALLMGLVLAGFAVKASWDSTRPWMRWAGPAYAALMLVAALYPAKHALMPGAPDAERLLQPGESLSLPSSGDYRLLVHAPIEKEGEGQIAYRLLVGVQRIDGTLERVFAYRRSGRRGSVRVAETHDIKAHEVKVSGPTEVKLDDAKGLPAGEGMTVRAYREMPRAFWYVTLVLVFLGALLLEAKANARGTLAMVGATAGLYGIMIETANPDPNSSLGVVIASAVMAAAGGALGGSLLNTIGKKLLVRGGAPKKAEGRG